MGKSKRQREEGLRCARMPGEVFDTFDGAEQMRVTRQINVVTGGMGQVDYLIKLCGCGRHHLMTSEHFTKWDTMRRARQRERRRNA